MATLTTCQPLPVSQTKSRRSTHVDVMRSGRFCETFALLLTPRFFCLFVCLASEAMRGSTPLDVAASSVMDNNGLALALEEPDLEKVCYSCMLTEK